MGGEAEEGRYTSDEENDEGEEGHLIASKRRAGLSKWLRVSIVPSTRFHRRDTMSTLCISQEQHLHIGLLWAYPHAGCLE